MTSAAVKRKFNVFDALILLVALVAIAGVVYILSGKASPKLAKTTHVEYQVEINGVIPELKNAAQAGDSVRDGVKHVSIGTIKSVTVKPYTVQIADYDDGGKYVNAVVGDRSTVVLTIEADANETAGRYAVNGSSISIGNLMYIQSKHFAGEGYCIGFTSGKNQ